MATMTFSATLLAAFALVFSADVVVSQQCTIKQVFGCYIDTVTPRTLPNQASNAYSLEECAKKCYNLGYPGTAGVENGEECWCSAATGPIGQSASSDDCNKLCPDDTSEMCGGLSRLTEFSFHCSGVTTYFSCNQNNRCVEDPDGAYTDPNCNGQCSRPPYPSSSVPWPSSSLAPPSTAPAPQPTPTPAPQPSCDLGSRGVSEAIGFIVMPCGDLVNVTFSAAWKDAESAFNITAASNGSVLVSIISERHLDAAWVYYPFRQTCSYLNAAVPPIPGSSGKAGDWTELPLLNGELLTAIQTEHDQHSFAQLSVYVASRSHEDGVLGVLYNCWPLSLTAQLPYLTKALQDPKARDVVQRPTQSQRRDLGSSLQGRTEQMNATSPFLALQKFVTRDVNPHTSVFKLPDACKGAAVTRAKWSSRNN